MVRVANDRAKWSPEAATAANGKTYRRVTFIDASAAGHSLLRSAMTVEAGVPDVDHPALCLRNQPAADDNHTTSWDEYQIPPIISD